MFLLLFLFTLYRFFRFISHISCHFLWLRSLLKCQMCYNPFLFARHFYITTSTYVTRYCTYIVSSRLAFSIITMEIFLQKRALYIKTQEQIYLNDSLLLFFYQKHRFWGAVLVTAMECKDISKILFKSGKYFIITALYLLDPFFTSSKLREREIERERKRERESKLHR